MSIEELGYQKVYHNKVVRVEHKLNFKEGWDALGIKQILGKVPDSAKLTDIIDGEEYLSLCFLEEKVEK